MLTINLKESKCLENGINVHNLKPGCMVLAVTKNSLYKIIKGEEQSDITIQGGKKFLKPIDGIFAGSNFGGSMLKLGWIGYGMRMEIYIPSYGKTYITTSVKSAKVIGDGWEYDMEWEKGGEVSPFLKNQAMP